MKKILSVLLAVSMLLALCIPAFAADIAADGGTGDTIIKTATLKDTDSDGVGDTDAESFKVTIPADTTLPWGTADTTTALPYYVESHLSLSAGASLSVSAAANADGKMTNANTADTLQMIVSNGGATTFSGENTAATPAVQPSVHVETFDNKAVGQYTGTVTYTVTYTPAP